MKQPVLTFTLTQEKFDKLILLLHEIHRLDDPDIENIANDLCSQASYNPSDEQIQPLRRVTDLLDRIEKHHFKVLSEKLK